MGTLKTRESHRTTLHLAPELHKRLRLLAIEKETTLTEIVTEALERYVKTEEPKIRRNR